MTAGYLYDVDGNHIEDWPEDWPKEIPHVRQFCEALGIKYVH